MSSFWGQASRIRPDHGIPNSYNFRHKSYSQLLYSMSIFVLLATLNSYTFATTDNAAGDPSAEPSRVWSGSDADLYNRLQYWMVPLAGTQEASFASLADAANIIASNLTDIRTELEEIESIIDASSKRVPPGLMVAETKANNDGNALGLQILNQMKLSYDDLARMFQTVMQAVSSASAYITSILTSSASTTSKTALAQVKSMVSLGTSLATAIVKSFTAFNQTQTRNQAASMRRLSLAGKQYNQSVSNLLYSLQGVNKSSLNSREALTALKERFASSLTNGTSSAEEQAVKAQSAGLSLLSGLSVVKSAAFSKKLDAASAELIKVIQAIRRQAALNLSRLDAGSLNSTAPFVLTKFNRTMAKDVASVSKARAAAEKVAQSRFGELKSTVSSQNAILREIQMQGNESFADWQSRLIGIKALQASSGPEALKEAHTLIASPPWLQAIFGLQQEVSEGVSSAVRETSNLKATHLFSAAKDSGALGEKFEKVSDTVNQLSDSVDTASSLVSAEVQSFVNSQTSKFQVWAAKTASAVEGLNETVDDSFTAASSDDDSFESDFSTQQGTMSEDSQTALRMHFEKFLAAALLAEDEQGQLTRNQNETMQTALMDLLKLAISKGDFDDTTEAMQSLASFLNVINSDASFAIGNLKQSTSQSVLQLHGELKEKAELAAQTLTKSSSANALQLWSEFNSSLSEVASQRQATEDVVKVASAKGAALTGQAKDSLRQAKLYLTRYQTSVESSVAVSEAFSDSTLMKFKQDALDKMNRAEATSAGFIAQADANAKRVATQVSTQLKEQLSQFDSSARKRQAVVDSLIDALGKNTTTVQDFVPKFNQQVASAAENVSTVTKAAEASVEAALRTAETRRADAVHAFRTLINQSNDELGKARTAYYEATNASAADMSLRMRNFQQQLNHYTSSIDQIVKQVSNALRNVSAQFAVSVDSQHSNLETTLVAFISRANDSASLIANELNASIAGWNESMAVINETVNAISSAQNSTANETDAALNATVSVAREAGLAAASKINDIANGVSTFLKIGAKDAQTQQSHLRDAINEFQVAMHAGADALNDGFGSVVGSMQYSGDAAVKGVSSGAAVVANVTAKTSLIMNFTAQQLADLIQAVTNADESSINAAAIAQNVSISGMANIAQSLAAFTALVQSALNETSRDLRTLSAGTANLSDDVNGALVKMGDDVAKELERINSNVSAIRDREALFFPKIRVLQSGLTARGKQAQSQYVKRVTDVMKVISATRKKLADLTGRTAFVRTSQIQRLQSWIRDAEKNYTAELTGLTNRATG